MGSIPITFFVFIVPAFVCLKYLNLTIRPTQSFTEGSETKDYYMGKTIYSKLALLYMSLLETAWTYGISYVAGLRLPAKMHL